MSQMPRFTLPQMETLFAEYQSKLTRYANQAALTYYWPGNPAQVQSSETEQMGRELHALHIEAYEAGEMYRGALRSLFL